MASRGGGIDAQPAGNAVGRRTERHPQRTGVARTDPACRVARTSAQADKADLIETLIRQALQLIEVKQHCTPYLAALGLLLNRTPFHAGPESVVPPEMVAPTYAAFQDFDWAEGELLEIAHAVLAGSPCRRRPKPGCPKVAAQPDRHETGESGRLARGHR